MGAAISIQPDKISDKLKVSRSTKKEVYSGRLFCVLHSHLSTIQVESRIVSTTATVDERQGKVVIFYVMNNFQ